MSTRTPVAKLGSVAVDAYRVMEYSYTMRIKTSVTLSASTVRAIDELAAPDSNRSQTIERAVLEFIERRRRERREGRDLEILNGSSEALNRETEDILGYQTEP